MMVFFYCVFTVASWSGDLLRSSVLESLEDGRPVDTVMMSQWRNGRYVIGAQGGVMIVVDSESLNVLNVIKMVGYYHCVYNDYTSFVSRATALVLVFGMMLIL